MQRISPLSAGSWWTLMPNDLTHAYSPSRTIRKTLNFPATGIVTSLEKINGRQLFVSLKQGQNSLFKALRSRFALRCLKIAKTDPKVAWGAKSIA
jgi:hypothetical protein